MTQISDAPVVFKNQHLKGENVDRINRQLKDLSDIFSDKKAFAKLPGDTVVYEVESFFPVATGTDGGLFYGITYIHPGLVGNEYFMTKGHFHKKRNRAEVYTTLSGEGMLILMDEQGNTRAEKMMPGSIHYIHAHTAHRTANTGNSVLAFGAVWPADAGHDYEIISHQGFSSILVKENGQPALVQNRLHKRNP